MERKEFLKLLGITMTGTVAATCMGGCGKEENTGGTGGNNNNNVNIDLDLTSSTYSKLQTKGNYVQIESTGIVVAFSTDGNYYAADLTCPHENGIIEFESAGNRFHCTKHPKQYFSNKGVSNGAETGDNLKMFTCTLSGTKLNVKS
jgi:cytochrome b6-f complex iron-sulfur subunit